MTGYSEKILSVLEPGIGRNMAKSALKIKCKKLGITPEEISRDDVLILADDLYEPLRIFAGEEFAKSMTSQIKNISGSS
ncbi:MAG: hypothetical protein ABFC24_00510 [Methanoregulaceae archaeon]